MSRGAQSLILLPATTIGAAVTAVTTPVTALGLTGMTYLALQAAFLYGAGGTTVKAYVQTSLDGGVTWVDVACFAFALAAATRLHGVHIYTAPGVNVTPTDGALADNTVLNGYLGDRLRVKYVTTGTYTGATSLAITAVTKGVL